MARKDSFAFVRVDSPELARAARPVAEAVYFSEKRWVDGASCGISESELSCGSIAWFAAINETDGRAVGLIRLYFDPELELPEEYGVRLEEGVNLSTLGEGRRFAEIGRFMVLPEYRGELKIALGLMRAAIKETIERGYSHFITDVFEGEPTSPYHFHTRVLGFEKIGTHERGELHCDYKRVILTLDIMKAWKRIRGRRGALFAQLTQGIESLLDRRLEESSRTVA
jgi:hypothetical protein